MDCYILYGAFLASQGKLVLLFCLLFELLLLYPIDFGSLCFHIHLSPEVHSAEYMYLLQLSWDQNNSNHIFLEGLRLQS